MLASNPAACSTTKSAGGAAAGAAAAPPDAQRSECSCSVLCNQGSLCGISSSPHACFEALQHDSLPALQEGQQRGQQQLRRTRSAARAAEAQLEADRALWSRRTTDLQQQLAAQQGQAAAQQERQQALVSTQVQFVGFKVT